MTEIDAGTARSSTMPTDAGDLYLSIAALIEKEQRLSTTVTDNNWQQLHD